MAPPLAVLLVSLDAPVNAVVDLLKSAIRLGKWPRIPPYPCLTLGQFISWKAHAGDRQLAQLILIRKDASKIPVLGHSVLLSAPLSNPALHRSVSYHCS